MKPLYIIVSPFDERGNIPEEAKIRFEKEWQVSSEYMMNPKFLSLQNAIKFLEDISEDYKKYYRIERHQSGSIETISVGDIIL